MRKSLKNVVYGLGGQIIIFVLGLAIPRFILKNYSDEANGLLNAVNQIFTYLALIEAGIGQAALQSLYKPVVDKDNDSISAIMSATQRQYRKLVWVYAGVMMLFAFIYPVVITIEDASAISLFGSTYWSVFLLIFLQGISGVISFSFVASYKQLFIADGQNYVISNLTTLTQILVAAAKLVLISITANIVFLQLAYLAINMLVAVLYYFMFKKKYKQVDFKAKPDKSALSQKNSFLVHEISSAILSSTDILLLSVFCDLKIASVYAIYNLIFSALNQLIHQVHNGCYYILGQKYNSDKEEYPKVHDAYDTLYVALVFTFITAAYLLINPFVEIYTKDASSINYIDKYLPVLFAVIQLLSGCRITASNLVKISGHAKRTVPRTIAESAIHVVASTVLVQFLGIYGVLLGTLSALLYRANDFIVYSNVIILKRSCLRQYARIGCYFGIFAILAVALEKADIHFDSYLGFVLAGAIVTSSLALIYFGMALAFNADVRKALLTLLRKLKRKAQDKKS